MRIAQPYIFAVVNNCADVGLYILLPFFIALPDILAVMNCCFSVECCVLLRSHNLERWYNLCSSQ